MIDPMVVVFVICLFSLIGIGATLYCLYNFVRGNK